MSKGLIGGLGIAAVIALAVIAFLFLGYPAQTRDLDGLSGDAGRGEYVSRLGGCAACHSDPKAENGFMAGGLPIETPFGNFVAPNITPHPQAGIGAWTLDDFANALINGLSPEGRHYYPAFPYASYQRMSDQDIVDLWAYFRSLPAIEQKAPDNDLSFPFNIRALMGPWKTLFLTSARFTPDPAKSDQWNRGAYIVTGPGHCGECHTPRGPFGNALTDQALSGSRPGKGGEKFPGITRQQLVDGGWTPSLIAIGLKIGITPTGDFLGGSMGEVLTDSTGHYTDDDLAAVGAYLFDE